MQIYLKLNRPDLAKKEVDKLKSTGDDSVLAQLLEAWVDLYTVTTYLSIPKSYIYM